jgi:lipopolysaccharide export system protein LptA
MPFQISNAVLQTEKESFTAKNITYQESEETVTFEFEKPLPVSLLYVSPTRN